MAKKRSAAGAAEKQLKAAVKKLQSQLAAAEKSAEKWKARAKDHKSVASAVKSELSGVRRRLEKAEASVGKWKNRAQAPDPAAAAPAPAVAATPTEPDESWTVTALRAEARKRGLAGYSRKTKAELLAELRR
jgi:chromosome segregation ATPase